MRPKKKAVAAKYYFIPYQAVFDAYAQKKASSDELELNEEHLYPLGDPSLEALREVFSLTYPGRMWEADSKARLEKIRDTAVGPLKELAPQLASLGLEAVGAPVKEGKAAIFKLVIIPSEKLPPTIKPSELVQADTIIIALRKVLTFTFSEAYEIPEFTNIFAKIRKIAALALVPYNPILEYLEIEPVAKPHIFHPGD